MTMQGSNNYAVSLSMCQIYFANFFLSSFIEIKMIYNIMLVKGVQHNYLTYVCIVKCLPQWFSNIYHHPVQNFFL